MIRFCFLTFRQDWERAYMIKDLHDSSLQSAKQKPRISPSSSSSVPTQHLIAAINFYESLMPHKKKKKDPISNIFGHLSIIIYLSIRFKVSDATSTVKLPGSQNPVFVVFFFNLSTDSSNTVFTSLLSLKTLLLHYNLLRFHVN